MTPQTEATGRVRLAIARLADAYPLHAGILAQWRLIEDAGVGTMCVGMRDGRLHLKYSPAFVGELTIDQLTGVVHHEANHVLFGHVLRGAEPGEDRRARIIAEETVCNEWIAEPLPGQPILLSDFTDLPANEDTDTRYDRLVQRASLPDRHSIDDHGSWSEITEDPILGDFVVSVAVGMAWDALADDQKKKVDRLTVEQASKLCGSGTMNAGSASLVGGRASVPWQTVLRRYAGSVLTVRPMYGRPPRRFPHLVGVLPGKARHADKPRIMACIDTSGSLSDKNLADISAELARLGKMALVTVVECDTQIHAVYRYTKPITGVRGRGGTDLKPPLEPAFLRQHKPDLVLYFTDGCGPVPDKAPAVPVVWVLTCSGTMPCTWGRKVQMTG
jgi:predicted metal-dependent peptidase